MKISCLFAGLLLISTGVSSRSVDVCPTLPDNSGYAWKYKEGPDFDLCYASKPGSASTYFGIYLGNFPSFNPSGETPIGKSSIAGNVVNWYSQGASKFSRQALLVLDKKSGYVAHIWITAETKEELQASLTALEHITFRS